MTSFPRRPFVPRRGVVGSACIKISSVPNEEYWGRSSARPSRQLAVPRKPYFIGLGFVGKDLIYKFGVPQGYSGQFGPSPINMFGRDIPYDDGALGLPVSTELASFMILKTYPPAIALPEVLEMSLNGTPRFLLKDAHRLDRATPASSRIVLLEYLDHSPTYSPQASIQTAVFHKSSSTILYICLFVR